MFQELNRGLPKLPTLRAYREMTPLKRREMREGLLFISPWLIGFLIFTLLPMVASLIFSFIDLKHHRRHYQRAQVRGAGQLCPDVQGPADLVPQERHARLAVDHDLFWVDCAAGGDLPAAGHCAADEQPASQGADGFSQHVLHALHHPLRGRDLSLGRHAQPGDRLDQPRR